MIRIAKECGADKVKGQAILGRPHGGTMSNAFYQSVELRAPDYLEAIHYGELIGIPVFYSIFSEHLSWLYMHQNFHKVSAGKMLNLPWSVVDRDNIYASINEASFSQIGGAQDLRCTLFYATPYMADSINFERLVSISKCANKFGLSDHTIGIGLAVKAKEFGITAVEKHFTLVKDFSYDGHIFRDTVHAATPEQFGALARELKK